MGQAVKDRFGFPGAGFGRGMKKVARIFQSFDIQGTTMTCGFNEAYTLA
jgi:hypothetical protein